MAVPSTATATPDVHATGARSRRRPADPWAPSGGSPRGARGGSGAGGGTGRGCHRRNLGQERRQLERPPFPAIRPGAAPTGWLSATLPDGAVLWYPPSMRPVTADPGAASAVRLDHTGGSSPEPLRE